LPADQGGTFLAHRSVAFPLGLILLATILLILFSNPILALYHQQQAELRANLESLPSQMESLQSRIQALDNERRRLELEYQIANETLTTLTRKLDEVRIAIQDNTGYAAIAAYPTLLQDPVPRGTLRNTALATALGGFLAVFGVLVWDWWRSEEEERGVVTGAALEKPKDQPAVGVGR